MVREGFGWQLRWKCSSQARTVSVKLCHKETRGLCAEPHLGRPVSSRFRQQHQHHECYHYHRNARIRLTRDVPVSRSGSARVGTLDMVR
jgi:hypothetical protein